MEEDIVSVHIDLINNIILNYYTNEKDIYDDPMIEFHIINFLKLTLFKYSYEKLGYCLIQEFDKIHYNEVKNDVINYKFKEKDRILVSQFVNKIHFYIENNKKNV